MQISPIWRGRLILLAIIGLFLLPLFGAIWLFQRAENGHLWGTSNNGVLVQPAIPLKSCPVVINQTQMVDTNQLWQKWTLLYQLPANCDESCKQTIYHMRQMHIALGRDSDRVQRILLQQQPNQTTELTEFLKFYPNMLQIADSEGCLYQQLQTTAEKPPIYIIDPLGNWMMWVPADLEPKKMLKDLKKLLKISKIG